MVVVLVCEWCAPVIVTEVVRVAVVALVYDGASTIRVDRSGVTEEGKQYCRLDKEF